MNKKDEAAKRHLELRENMSDYERGFIDGMQKQMQSSVDKAVNRMAEQPAQQEPSDLDVWKARALQAEAVVAKFMAPQPVQRTWVGLTTADRKEIERQSVYVEGAIRLTEAKLKEKNT